MCEGHGNPLHNVHSLQAIHEHLNTFVNISLSKAFTLQYEQYLLTKIMKKIRFLKFFLSPSSRRLSFGFELWHQERFGVRVPSLKIILPTGKLFLMRHI